jgi:hypothetical protein
MGARRRERQSFLFPMFGQCVEPVFLRAATAIARATTGFAFRRMRRSAGTRAPVARFA